MKCSDMCCFNTCILLQINNLEDFSMRVGSDRRGMFLMKGGYTLANKEGLAKLSAAIEALGDHDALRDLIRVGVHSDVQVTSHSWGAKLIPPLTALHAASASAEDKSGTRFPKVASAVNPSASTGGAAAAAPRVGDVHSVTQVFCSAVACNYNKFTHRNDWLVCNTSTLS